MLKLILGRAPSDKSKYVRNIIAEMAEKECKITLVVPEQFSFESEKSVIELLGAKKAQSVSIVSFSSLSKKILDKFEPVRKPSVTQAAKEVIMSMVLEALSEKLDIYSRCTKNRKNVSDILKMTDELIQCSVSCPEMIKAANESGNQTLTEKTKELTLISELYETLLTERFSDDRYMINNAAEVIKKENIFKDSYVFFDEFSGFTSQENLILSAILQQANDVYVTFCADGITDLSGGMGALSFAVDNIRKLISLAQQNDVKIATPVIVKPDENYYNSQAISYIEQGVYEAVPEVYKNDAPEISVVAAKNPYEECEFVAMTAKKLVREKNLRYRDIVVVGRSTDYQRYLPFAFKKYGIPVFEDTRRSLENELIVRLASAALSVAAEGFTTDNIFLYLKTYITGIPEADITFIENYIIMWDIDGKRWLVDWKMNPDGFGAEENDKTVQTLERINNIRKNIVFPLLKLKDALSSADGFGCTKALYEFIIDIGADKNLFEVAKQLDETNAYECERSWDEFMNMMSVLADTVGNRCISSQRYLELFRIMASSSDIGDIPTGLDLITVGDADRIRVSDKKILFIVGANDGVFPLISQPSFVLTENERRILRIQGIELNDDGVDRARKERLRVYSALSIPKDMLFVSYSLNSFDGGSQIPSEIVTMVKRIVPGCRKTEISLLEPLYTIESEQSAFECSAMCYSDNTAFSQSLKNYILSSSDRDRFRSVERTVNKQPAHIEDGAKAVRIFGKDMFISPSRVELYYKCPFAYFCRYAVKANPVGKAQFDSRINGLLVHYVLEKMFDRYGSKALSKMSEDERREKVSIETDEFIDTQMGGKAELDKRFVYSLERSKNSICEILSRLAAEFSGSRFETRDVELRIASDGDVKPYELDIPDGGRVMLSGTVDRVDTMDSTENPGKTYLRIIDYKTGGKDFKLEDVMSGLNIQMLIYLMCLYENAGEKYGDILPAGILYVPAKKGKNELGRHVDDKTVDETRVAQGRMNGIVLGTPEAITGMEENGGGVIINASIDSNGVIKGSTFDLHQFSLLHKKIDELVSQMALSLHEGNVEAVPILDGSYKNTCDYCDYKPVCCREEDDAKRSIFKGKVWDVLEEENNG